MDGDAGWLVDADQRVVLVDDRKLASGRFRPLAAIGDPHRRNPDLVAERQAGVGGGATAVDAHLAGADDTVQVGARHALENLGEEVVEALAVGAGVDADVLHTRRRRLVAALRGHRGSRLRAPFGPYNALLHSRPSC